MKLTIRIFFHLQRWWWQENCLKGICGTTDKIFRSTDVKKWRVVGSIQTFSWKSSKTFSSIKLLKLIGLTWIWLKANLICKFSFLFVSKIPDRAKFSLRLATPLTSWYCSFLTDVWFLKDFWECSFTPKLGQVFFYQHF